MPHRIGLFTEATKKKKSGKTSTNVYVDVATVEDLSAALAKLGAKEVGQLCRERTGTTSLEGKMFPLSELNAKHLKWLTEKPSEFQTRGLFYR